MGDECLLPRFSTFFVAIRTGTEILASDLTIRMGVAGKKLSIT